MLIFPSFNQGLEGLNGDIPSLSHLAQTLSQLQKEMHEFHVSMVDVQERLATLEKHSDVVDAAKCVDKQEKVSCRDGKIGCWDGEGRRVRRV